VCKNSEILVNIFLINMAHTHIHTHTHTKVPLILSQAKTFIPQLAISQQTHEKLRCCGICAEYPETSWRTALSRMYGTGER